MYKYLLFDLDGTILNFLAAEKFAIRALFEKYGLGECSDEMLAQYSQINKRYWEALERGEMSKPEILVGRFREFFETVGVDPGLAAQFNADYQITLGDNVVFEDGALELLQSLKGYYRLIAVTNGTKAAQTKKLRVSGLDQIFDSVYISEDIGYEKPNLAYFDIMLKREGITDVREALIIGDSLTSDILGGNNAGIDTCWYNPGGTVNTKGVSVNYEVQHLSEITDLLK